MLDRKDINDLIKILPFTSETFGAPRKTATISKFAKACPSSGILKSTKVIDLHVTPFDLPSFFKAESFVEDCALFVAKLNNARVWGNNGAVIANGDYFISDVSREFNKGMNVSHSIFYTLKQIKARFLSGNVAVIGTAGANIYYHWMIDVLPRLGLLSDSISFDEIDYVITQFSELPFQIETLKKVGISAAKIVPSNKNKFFHVKAENLYVPSLAGPLDQPTRFQVNFLRSLYATELKEETSFRHIYVSRKKTSSRNIVNEDELLDYLSVYGFRTVYTEEMTVANQVRLFSTAKVIICSHGSALTNLVFCSPGTTVIDIFNKSYVNPCFWYLSQVNSLDYHFMSFTAVDVDGNPKNDHTIVDIDAFKKQLNKIGVLLNGNSKKRS